MAADTLRACPDGKPVRDGHKEPYMGLKWTAARGTKSGGSTFCTRSFWSLWLPGRSVSDWRWFVRVRNNPNPRRKRAERVAIVFLSDLGSRASSAGGRHLRGSKDHSDHFGFLNRKRLEVAGMRPCQSGTDAHMRRARRTPSNSSRHYAPPTACGRAVTQEKSQDLRISGLFFEWLWCLLFYFLFLFFRASSGISGPQDLRAFF